MEGSMSIVCIFFFQTTALELRSSGEEKAHQVTVPLSVTTKLLLYQILEIRRTAARPYRTPQAPQKQTKPTTDTSNC